MSQQLDIRIAGLYTFPSDISSVPQGALEQADEVVIDRDNIVEPRRGFDYLTYDDPVNGVTQSKVADIVNSIFSYQGYLVVLYEGNQLAWHSPTLGWQTYTGTFQAPDLNNGIPMRSAQANGNFYFTTSAGVYKLDAYNGTPVLSGCPPGLDINASIGGSTTTWLKGNFRTAYRILWGIKDANNNLILGAPSQRIAVTNTATTSTPYTFQPTDVSLTDNTITISGTALASGITGQFSTAGTLPAGLSAGVTYYVVTFGTNEFKFATSLSNAQLGITVEFTTVGSGTITFTANVINPSAVTLVSTVPTGITTTHFFQIYRSVSTDNSFETVEPNDEMGLVYEANPTSTDLTNGYVTVVDITPDALIGSTIYTAQSQEGIGNANEPIPYCQDLAVFRNCMFFGNTIGLDNFTLTLLGCGSPNGVQVGDTFSINDTVFSAKSSETTANGQFKVYSSGTAAQNIRDTALSLIRVINRDPASNWYAYYLSGVADLPGKIYITGRETGQGQFSLTSSRATPWSPQLPASGTLQHSSNDTLKNAVFYSKPSEPEAVSLANYIFVGSEDQDIYRVIALRDSLFILKSDGIFRLYGTDPSNFQVALLDNTAILIAPESARALNNQIYALTTQGVVTISESGVSIISRPIEASLTTLNTTLSDLRTNAFGVAYESQRTYYLHLPQVYEGGVLQDGINSQFFRYNYITQTWTHGFSNRQCGIVNPADDKLYYGHMFQAIVNVERKKFAATDYVDYLEQGLLSNVAPGNILTVSFDADVSVGMIVSQPSQGVFGYVTYINPTTGALTLNSTGAFVLGIGSHANTLDLLGPISCAVKWAPVTLGNPGYAKHIREVSFLFLSNFLGYADVTFSSDISTEELTEIITGFVGTAPLTGWGGLPPVPWGGPLETPFGVPWGGNVIQRRPARVVVPRIHQRSSILNVSFKTANVYNPWAIQGLSIIGDNIGERTTN